MRNEPDTPAANSPGYRGAYCDTCERDCAVPNDTRECPECGNHVDRPGRVFDVKVFVTMAVEEPVACAPIDVEVTFGGETFVPGPPPEDDDDGPVFELRWEPREASASNQRPTDSPEVAVARGIALDLERRSFAVQDLVELVRLLPELLSEIDAMQAELVRREARIEELAKRVADLQWRTEQAETWANQLLDVAVDDDCSACGARAEYAALADDTNWCSACFRDRRAEELRSARGKLWAIERFMDAHDDALCARKNGDVAARNVVDGVRTALGLAGFERRRKRGPLHRERRETR